MARTKRFIHGHIRHGDIVITVKVDAELCYEDKDTRCHINMSGNGKATIDYQPDPRKKPDDTITVHGTCESHDIAVITYFAENHGLSTNALVMQISQLLTYPDQKIQENGEPS
jgi:hypothetical protein